MRITILCEGKTEQAFKECLHSFLKPRLVGKMPSLRFDVHHGSIPTQAKLRRVVENLLGARTNPSDAVIGLTDIYPGVCRCGRRQEQDATVGWARATILSARGTS